MKQAYLNPTTPFDPSEAVEDHIYLCTDGTRKIWATLKRFGDSYHWVPITCVSERVIGRVHGYGTLEDAIARMLELGMDVFEFETKEEFSASLHEFI